HRVADAPKRLVGVGIVAAGHPHGAAAGLPGVVPILPRLAAGFARRRNGVFTPQELPSGRIQRRHPIAGAAVAAGGPEHDLVLDGKWGAGDGYTLGVGDVGFPYDLTGDLLGGDNPRRSARRRNDEIAP